MLTFLPGLLRPPREGAWCLHEPCKSCVKDFIGPLHKPRYISLFLSFTFLSLTLYHKVPVHLKTPTQQGLRFTLDFLSCLSTSAIIYPSPLSFKCSLPPFKGSLTSPQMLCPMSESPSGKREGLQDSATHKKGSLLLTRVRAPAASNAVVQVQKTPSPSCYTNL